MLCMPPPFFGRAYGASVVAVQPATRKSGSSSLNPRSRFGRAAFSPRAILSWAFRGRFGTIRLGGNGLQVIGRSTSHTGHIQRQSRFHEQHHFLAHALRHQRGGMLHQRPCGQHGDARWGIFFLQAHGAVRAVFQDRQRQRIPVSKSGKCAAFPRRGYHAVFFWHSPQFLSRPEHNAAALSQRATSSLAQASHAVHPVSLSVLNDRKDARAFFRLDSTGECCY